MTDPISIILSALVAGAAKSTGDLAQDAYNGLKNLIKRKFADNEAAKVVLDEYEKDPETYEAPLKKKLTEAKIDKDEEIFKLACDLLDNIAEKSDGQKIINQTQTNTASGNTVSGNFNFAPVQEAKTLDKT